MLSVHNCLIFVQHILNARLNSSENFIPNRKMRTRCLILKVETTRFETFQNEIRHTILRSKILLTHSVCHMLHIQGITTFRGIRNKREVLCQDEHNLPSRCFMRGEAYILRLMLDLFDGVSYIESVCVELLGRRIGFLQVFEVYFVVQFWAC